MSEIIYNLSEAKTSLSRLVDRAANGEEIILSKDGKPLAKLVPLHRSPKPRQPGGWEGQVRISDDFDAPLPPEIQFSNHRSSDPDSSFGRVQISPGSTARTPSTS
jgi:prevent-host-death family protein